ncbi:response regulator transcription factor [Gimesia aquarii]|uniref:Transcriptional regulatory protein YycF n=1 Tax=Gimesia aquarii TaxID=2527964 RepID=A0A517X047_9PLAN|nr:response regulator transcription factor [Gimesia aquarii]QDU10864.1 Transcriptional regulatory protein YycF [Gimesia aquarii]
MSGSKRILLVDDDTDILHATTMRLSVAGFETSTAHDGMEAAAAVIAEQPDAIVMDVRMPYKDGLTILDELKKESNTRQIPIVMLSASLIDKERALDAGASYFLTKPYEGHKLVEAVNAAIDDSATLSEAMCVHVATENIESEVQV